MSRSIFYAARTALAAVAIAGIIGIIGNTTAHANCGPGPVVVQKKKGMLLQSFGATTNATLLPTQTFAISSGTSGCSNDGLIRKDAEQRLFMAVNLDGISRDMARGTGDHLAALSHLLGCRREVYGKFALVARENFQTLLPDAGVQAAELLAGLKREMARHPALAGNCTRIT